MKADIVEKLSVITDEEQAILNGDTQINRNLYYSDKKKTSAYDEVDSARVLKDGKQIDMRPHVRFIHFPVHKHNYVEFIYMVKGSTTHIIDGQRITLKAGDLLFLNQHAKQEILPAKENDIAVNFMILPEFFDTAFSMLDQKDNPIRDFLISCLTKKNIECNYIYFDVSDIPQIQNLIENLIRNMLQEKNTDDYYSVNSATIGLLFLTLIQYTDSIRVSKRSYDKEIVFRLLRYIDTDYRDASLSAFAKEVSEDQYTLSRIIKRNTGFTFKELLQNKRFIKACELLKNTDIPIADISVMIGYDNTSFFHRLFRKLSSMSPKEYRNSNR